MLNINFFKMPMAYDAGPAPEKLIACGEAYGLRYFVRNFHGKHPCVYVALPIYHELNGKDYFWVEENYSITVHGGLTFSGRNIESVNTGNEGDWLIGWDYGHAWDYDPTFAGTHLGETSRKWEVDELVADAEDACKQFAMCHKLRKKPEDYVPPPEDEDFRLDFDEFASRLEFDQREELMDFLWNHPKFHGMCMRPSDE